jgi:hypothetical protein
MFLSAFFCCLVSDLLGEPLRGFATRVALSAPAPSHIRRTAVRLYVLRRVRFHRSRGGFAASIRKNKMYFI